MTFLSALVFFAASAQEGRIQLKGRVTADDAKEGLGGVTISVKGSRRGVTTASDGSFHFDIGNTDRQLILSYAGYESLVVDARNTDLSGLVLKKSNKQLDEVVVTGYSVQSRKFIAGSIATVKGDAIRDIPQAGFNQLLQGKTTGVQVGANSGVPGGGITFRVRGNNSINAYYAYLLAYSDYSATAALYQLLTKNVLVKTAFKPFTANLAGGGKRPYGYGTLVIPTRSLTVGRRPTPSFSFSRPAV
jgi:hypothetical protein